MKKLTLILTILILLPLATQAEEEYQDEYVQTGFILEVKDNKINFEEIWYPVVVQNEKTAQQIIIIDKAGNQISHTDIVAPCLVEVTHKMDQEGNMLPVKIKILKQHQYDSNGLMKKATM